MGEAVSLGVHESQSRLWENAVGRSRPFWAHFFPLARHVFHEALQDVALDDFHFAINHVEPSLIRVQADEVTYNLHILMRFELEQALLAGDLTVADVPAAWNEKSTALPRRHAPHRRRGLPAGHPLERRADRLLPDLHAGQPLRRAVLREGPRRARRPGRVVRAGRFRRPARLAPREGPPPGPALPLGPADRARDRAHPPITAPSCRRSGGNTRKFTNSDSNPLDPSATVPPEGSRGGSRSPEP